MPFPRRFGQPADQVPEEIQDPAMEQDEVADQEADGGSDEQALMDQIKQTPVDQEHVEHEAEEPSIVQYLEEQLGVEIPEHMYPKIQEYMAKQQGGSSEEQNAKAPVEAPKPVFRSFGQPG